MRTKILRSLLFICVGVCVGTAVWFSMVGRARGAAQEEPKRPILSKLPPIRNCAEHVKLVKAELKMLGENQVASLELENQAYVGVISISVETIVGKAKYGVLESGFSPDKPPVIVIAPGERKTITIGNLGSDSPIRIGAVTFADGTEEGCESSLKRMREMKDHDKRERPSQ